MPGALFSVWGKDERDVWVVGSDAKDGHGPLVLHYDGTRWIRKAVVSTGDLWWVHGFENGLVFMGGTDGTVLRFDAGRFTRVATPNHDVTVFGIWGARRECLGGGRRRPYGTGAFMWRLAGDRFEDVGPSPSHRETLSPIKVWGPEKRRLDRRSPGTSMHSTVRASARRPGRPRPLFTVHARSAGDLYAAVGGADLGVLIERGANAPWKSAAVPSGTRTLFGVWLTAQGGYAVGDDGTVLSRSSGAWVDERTGLAKGKGLHSVWMDATSGVWAAGGDILAPPTGQACSFTR
jgi:hypothetical protein